MLGVLYCNPWSQSPVAIANQINAETKQEEREIAILIKKDLLYRVFKFSINFCKLKDYNSRTCTGAAERFLTRGAELMRV